MTSKYSYQQARQLRQSIVDYYLVRDQRLSRVRRAAMSSTILRDGFNPILNGIIGETLKTLPQAWTCVVAPQMFDLLQAGADELKAFTVYENDLPADNGFVVFAEPFATDLGSDVPEEVRAFSWHVDDDCVHTWWFVHPTQPVNGATVIGMFGRTFKFGEEQTYDPDRAWTSLPPTFWSVIQRPWVRIETEANPKKRRVGRSKQRPERDVKLVYLRFIDPISGDPVGIGPIERTHRWWCKGHWQRRKFKDGITRKIWIPEHLRGPEDKPVKERETVHVLAR